VAGQRGAERLGAAGIGDGELRADVEIVAGNGVPSGDEADEALRAGAVHGSHHHILT